MGLTGTVVTAMLSANFVGEFLLNPAVYIEVKGNNTSKPVMLVTNDGSQPAHNLSLFIQGSGRIVNITNILSTTDVKLVQPQSKPLVRDATVPINNSSLEIFAPQLVSGIGSKLEIETLLESQSRGIRVSGVYEEGSAIGSTFGSIIRYLSFFFPVSAFGLQYSIRLEHLCLLQYTSGAEDGGK